MCNTVFFVCFNMNAALVYFPNKRIYIKKKEKKKSTQVVKLL